MVAFRRDFLVAEWVNEWMDGHPFYYSCLGFRYYSLSIYIRPNGRCLFTPVYLWDISEEESGGQVCLGPESPLIFKPESDAGNSCSVSAFRTRWNSEVSWGSWCSRIGYTWGSPAEPHLVCLVLVLTLALRLLVLVLIHGSHGRFTSCRCWTSSGSGELPGLLVSWWERAGRKNGHLPPNRSLPLSRNKTVIFQNR